MPYIPDFRLFLAKNVTNKKNACCHLSDFTPFLHEQKGQTCKLFALSVVLNSMHTFYGMPKPLPAYKKKTEAGSLRQLAKKKYDSQVGEVYSAQTLVKLARDNGYNNCSTLTCNTYEQYASQIVRSINSGETPIIFFDLDFEKSGPGLFRGLREHAAVVVGYFATKSGELCFIVTQNGSFYWEKAHDYFASTSQLSSQRASETFFKYQSGWHDMLSINRDPNLKNASPSNCRQAYPLPHGDGGLKNKILIVHRACEITLAQAASPLAITATESTKLFESDLARYSRMNHY